jgi:adenylate kinase
MLAARGRKIDAVLELKVNDQVLLDRVEQRIKEGGVLRSDDTPDTLRHRLGVYYKNTAPLLDYYGKQGKVVTIDGMASIAAVTEKIAAVLGQIP